MKKMIVSVFCALLAAVFLADAAKAQDIGVLSRGASLNNAIFKFGGHSLNRRLGDLRRADRGGSAVWAGGFYNDYSKAGDYKIDANFWGFEGGVDIEVSGGAPNRLYLGLMAGYMENAGDIKIAGAAASEKSAFWGGMYGVWLNDGGWFAALTGRSFAPESKIASMENTKAAWDMMSFSLEGGKEFKFDINNSSFFKLEPKLRGVYGHTGAEEVFNGAAYWLRYNGMDVFATRAALMAAYAKTFDNCLIVEPYIEGGYNRDFSADAKVNDSNGDAVSVKLKGGSWDAGGGLNIIFNERFSFFSYGGYEKGNNVKNISANAGLRISFGGVRDNACGAQKIVVTPAPVIIIEEPAAAPVQVLEKKGDTLNIGDSYFTFNNALIGPHLRDYLKLQADALKAIDYDKLVIVGHTDSSGPEAYNQDLSERRAKSVADYLIREGVPSEKIEYYGMGEAAPVADNATPDGRALNRRVDITVE